MPGDLTPDELHDLYEFLSVIERQEAGLLTWGMVDAAFKREELETLAEEFLDEHPGFGRYEPGELVDQLYDRNLLHRFNRSGVILLRSRMAETIRLLARLRQIFPNKPWQAGRRLVADYRLVVRRRERPIRDVTPGEVLDRLTAADVDLSATRRDAVTAYLTPGGQALSLAGFQVHATQEILRRIDGGHSAACVVTAGTGSGKTHAFYLPALVHLAELIDAGGEAWMKALAIYPRSELLKDQLANAFGNARKLDALQTHRGRRPITIGAWFGPTPYGPEYPPDWPAGGGGNLCPFLPCPSCKADLVWTERARIAGQEVVRCIACAMQIGPEHFVFTRRAMAESPPDLLFTTTESLNRQLASKRYARVFGAGATRRPRLCLLDEIHTYEGVHGAQVALLLRRWRHAAGRGAVFVGLSATLENATAFMADLTGLPESQVVAVQAAEEQLERTSMEYLLALRHDPGSGTAVLSTTIQTAMLMARMIDPPGVRDGVAGNRVFAFTDRLDSVNRLYWDLLDAEGWFAPGYPLRRSPLALATIRAPDRDAPAAQEDRRRGAGQSWDMAQHMGHDLENDRQLGVGRTTSQDVGVHAQAEVIVATASLEVGYDDDRVGVVIQHKAPHDPARFIQRKGRAGRRPETRPWSVVVLTDLGRDRIAYQAYDQLFSPRLAPNRLPVANRYVLRIQAVYSLLDYLGRRLQVPGDWRQFAAPAPAGDKGKATRGRQQAVVAELRRILNDAAPRQMLENHIGTALRLSPRELQAVLWDPPRSLMTAVIPTLLRRLETNWAGETVVESDGGGGAAPLPEFMPPNLFSDLLLPEVEFDYPVPRSTAGHDRRGVGAAMGEFWIGNVSRRYAVRDRNVRHWAPPPVRPADGDPDVVVLDDYPTYECSPEETFRYVDDGGVVEVAGFRLRAVHLAIAESHVKNSSRGQPIWAGDLDPLGDGRQLPVPEGSGWEDRLAAVHAFLHRDGSAVAVTRFARGAALTEVTREGTRTRRLTLATRRGDHLVDAGVGFTFEADGLRLALRQPGPELAGLMDLAWLRRSRAAYTYHRFDDGRGFPDDIVVFQRHWLRLALLGALLTERRPDETGLTAALDRLSAAGLGASLSAILDVMFETIADSDDDTEEAQRGATHAALVALCERPEVVAAVAERAVILTSAPDDAWLEWERRRLRSTLGAAVLRAAAELCPDVDPEDLIVDVDPIAGDEPAEGCGSIWLTETGPGGNGIVERMVDAWRNDPVRFLRIMRRALEPTGFEQIDDELSRILDVAAASPDVAGAFVGVRSAWRVGHRAVADALERLRDQMNAEGVVLTRQVMVALNTRILSPGSSPASDEAMRALLKAWIGHEEAAGVELESRLVAVALAGDVSFDAGLNPVGGGEPMTPERRYDLLANLLWPRGGDLRLVSLMPPNPYVSVDQGEREGLAGLLTAGPSTVAVDDPHRSDVIAEALCRDGHVIVEAPVARVAELRAALLELSITPVDSGFLLSYPRVAACDRVDGCLRALLELPEVKA